MDVFNDILTSVHFKSAVYFKHTFCSNWGMNIEKGNFAQFHLVVRGQCRLELENGEVSTLNGGDVVIFPHGTPHRILDHEATACIPGAEATEAIQAGQPMFDEGTPHTTLICGHYELDHSLQHPFFENLPNLILVPGFGSESREGIRYLIEMIIEESGTKKPGATTIETKLAEVLFIKVLRHYMKAQSSTSPSFIRAFSEPIVSKALNLIHESPSEDWSVESLAHEVGASRTSFINKFKSNVGETPMKYLARWRMIKAKALLTESKDSLYSISAAIGYHSEAAFIRAFKQHFNTTPGSFRKSLIA